MLRRPNPCAMDVAGECLEIVCAICGLSAAPALEQAQRNQGAG